MLSLVTAVIKPHKLNEVKEALGDLGVTGITVTEVKGFGRQGGHTESYRGAEYQIDFIPKIKLEILLDAADADRLVEVVSKAAGSGKIGDGKIWTSAVDRAVRIRTGELGTDAI